MRIWYIPYGYLDSQRLTSQHYESTGMITICLGDKKWGVIADKFRRSVHYIVASHDKAAVEMGIRRGETSDILLNHSTPVFIPEGTDPIYTSEPFRPTKEDLTIDIIQLRNKWEREGYYFGTGRCDLAFLEQRVGLKSFRTPEEALDLKAQTRELLKKHKDFIKTIKGDKRTGDKLDALVEHLGEDPLGRRYHDVT